MGKPKSPTVTVTCATCSAHRQVTVAYHAKSATGIFFCGNDCRNAYGGTMPHPGRQEPRVTFPCAVCGKPKSVTAGYAAKNITGRYFCSEACRKILGTKPRRKPLVTCEICSTSFYPAGTNNRGRFCSKACYDAWQISRSARVTFSCDVCGIDFQRKPSQDRPNVRWCSHKCRGIARTTSAFEDRWHNGKPVRQNDQGYLLVFEPGEPDADRSGWVLEHRFVANQHVERRLKRREQVHHVDGTKTNNAWSNLEILDAGEHTAVTLREASMRRRAAQKRIREDQARIQALEAEIAALKAVHVA